MPDIYDQHRTAFAQVSAYVIMYNRERVATIAFKYPRDGAGRLYAYVHWLGIPMVRGYAGGYGYDKHTAACANAMRKLAHALIDGLDVESFGAFYAALREDGGHHWDSMLREAGFDVVQAV